MNEVTTSQVKVDEAVNVLPEVFTELFAELQSTGIEIGYDFLQITFGGENSRVDLLAKVVAEIGDDSVGLEVRRLLAHRVGEMLSGYLADGTMDSYYSPMISEAAKIQLSASILKSPVFIGQVVSLDKSGVARLELKVSFVNEDELDGKVCQIRKVGARALRAVE